MNGVKNIQSEAEKYTSDIALDIILSLLTCFIYGFFWQARKIRALNYLLDEEKYNFIRWLLLSIVTCGIYHFYHEYIMAESIMEIQKKFNKPVSANLPTVSIILTFFGGGIVTDAIQQVEINKIFGK